MSPAPDRAAGDRGLARLAAVAAVATLVLIALGGAVRATDSGLACPDWPACYGQWIPAWDMHIWLEHSHRLLAGVVGLLILAVLVWALRAHRERRDLWVPAALAAVLVLIQSALGAAVVLLLLRAELVTAHLGMSLVVLACLLLVAVNASLGPGQRGAAGWQARWARRVAALVFAQTLLGGQATGVAAAYVFNAVPFWTAEERVLAATSTRELMHLAHRGLGYVVAGIVLWFAIAAIRRGPGPGEDRRVDRWLSILPRLAAGLVVLQVGLGLANVLTQAAVASAIPHLAVASWLWTVLLLCAMLAARRGVAQSRERVPSAREEVPA